MRDGAATDLAISGNVYVHGSLEGNHGSTISSNASNLFFHAGASYVHHYTNSEGSLPLADWHKTSVIHIAGYTSATAASVGGNWGQDFGTMIWNTANLQSSFDLMGRLDHVKGDLIIQSTNSQRLLMSSMAGTDELVVDENFQLLGSSAVELTNSSSGHYTLRTGNDVVVNTTGTLSMANQGIGVIRPGNDITLINGIISESGTGTGEFNFSNSSKHRFDRGTNGVSGALNGRINYVVAASDTLELLNAVLPAGVGTNNGNILSVSGTLMVGATDAAGAIQNNTTGGNIRTTVSLRTFSSGSRVIYAGTQAQFLGNAGEGGLVQPRLQ